MSKHKTHRGGPLDVIRYGQQGASVKSRVSPQMWHKIVALAHKRGFTVAGALSGNPTPLKERTNSSLLSQAQKMVSQAYDPSLKQLDAQQAQLSALSDKRKADNAAYQQWLMGKQAEYNAQAAASQQQYQTYLDNLKASTEQAHQQAQAGAQAAVQGQPGTVSNMAQSSAIQGLSNDTTRAVGLVDNARQQTAAMIPSLQMRQEANRQAVIGQGQAAEAKRVSDLNTGLQQLGDQRFKLLAAKASDTFKQYASALSQQVDIANSNRSYQAAADQLGLKQQQFQFDVQKANRDYKLNRDKLSASELDARARRKIQYAKIRATKGQKEADRQLKREIAREKAKGGGSGGAKPLTTKDQAKVYQDAQTAYGMYKDLLTKHPNGILNNGQTIQHYLRGKGVSDPLYTLAADLAANGGKLSPQGHKIAKSLGIQHPYNMFGKATGAPYNGRH